MTDAGQSLPALGRTAKTVYSILGIVLATATILGFVGSAYFVPKSEAQAAHAAIRQEADEEQRGVERRLDKLDDKIDRVLQLLAERGPR